MPILTPSFLFDFESNMQAIVEDEYSRLSMNLWWSKYMKTRPTGSRQEIVAWLLTTAQIEDLEKFGGKVPFEDLVSTYTTFEPKFAGAGLKLRRAQIEDLDGNGLSAAAKWSADIGAYMAYWPQKQAAALLKNGHLAASKSYDNVPFFSAAHPLNPYNVGAGTYQNIFTGAASGAYPGACPIDDSVSLDVALVNLAKMVAYVKSIKMPNGVDPRMLRPTGLIVPPRMQQRAVQLTNAKFIAQAATGGAGSADVEALIQSFGFVEPTIADELAGFESDTSFFLACESISKSTLGGLVYVDREAFKINYYTGQGGGTGVDAILDRAEELEYHCKGRNVAGYGHPYAMFKGKAT
ncbi:MAG: putative major head subunit protein [Myxococcaceae bacterium]|nr:putative major head subunit protein [Myxococcaceae bacterium]